jgi:hypothetical protein
MILHYIGSKKNSPVFIAVVDDEPDLAYLFRDALDQIPGITGLRIFRSFACIRTF